MGKWYGKECKYQCCQWEDNEFTGGPDFKENHPALIFCDNHGNPDDYEGNCTETLCPLQHEVKDE